MADQLTEWLVACGGITINELRAKTGLAPMPGGDQVVHIKPLDGERAGITDEELQWLRVERQATEFRRKIESQYQGLREPAKVLPPGAKLVVLPASDARDPMDPPTLEYWKEDPGTEEKPVAEPPGAAPLGAIIYGADGSVCHFANRDGVDESRQRRMEKGEKLKIVREEAERIAAGRLTDWPPYAFWSKGANAWMKVDAAEWGLLSQQEQTRVLTDTEERRQMEIRTYGYSLGQPKEAPDREGDILDPAGMTFGPTCNAKNVRVEHGKITADITLSEKDMMKLRSGSYQGILTGSRLVASPRVEESPAANWQENAEAVSARLVARPSDAPTAGNLLASSAKSGRDESEPEPIVVGK